ncbi:src kinase-associated phosphoprotein 2-like [Limulus polyphemus]|uniref:Src kinase-associated phosphoprotein 2-like n=1 Tax=Limulus polyphemus TaxID=6850 RepID=A0ABM1C5U6_LIMPO|nr:src kinase-associated phosphoprotein 2-like [Limulus polyphemus]
MSKFHETVREVLEDVQVFLLTTLNAELLSTQALAHKERILIKLHHLQQEYPQLQLSPLQDSTVSTSSSPIRKCSVSSIGSRSESKQSRQSVRPPSSSPPYVDMQMSGSAMSPVESVSNTEYIYSQDCQEKYEHCEADRSTISFEQASVEKKFSGELEDLLQEGVPAVPAVELSRAEKCGFLEKKGKERLGGLLNPLQRRWCAIRDGILYYYERPTDRRQKGQIFLLGYEANPAPTAIKDISRKDVCFELVCPGKRTFQFCAVTRKDMNQWIAAIERNNIVSPKLESSGGGDAVDSLKLQPPCGGMDTASLTTQQTSTSSLDDGQISVAHQENSSEEEDIYEVVEGEGGTSHRPVEEPLYDEGESGLAGDDEDELYTDAESSITNHVMDAEIVPEDWYVGLWDCTTVEENELSFLRGDLIRIISKEYDNFSWWIGELDGKIGLVPKSFLMEAYELEQ